MPQVHFIKKARKTHRGTGISKNQPYYWWKFFRGSKHYSLVPPRPSQLTQSPFWSEVFSIQESLGDAGADAETVQADIDELMEKIEGLRDETQEKIDNQPESMADGPVAELLTGRVEVLDEVISTLEELDPEDDPESAWQGACDAVENISCE